MLNTGIIRKYVQNLPAFMLLYTSIFADKKKKKTAE